MPKSRAIFDTSIMNRSRVTNGTAMLDGIDGRSSQARRYRDLQIAFADDLGGADKLNESDKALIRQAAGLTMQSEAMQAAVVRGEAVDPEQMVRVSNVLTRVLTRISGKSKSTPPAKRTLADIIAAGAKAAA